MRDATIVIIKASVSQVIEGVLLMEIEEIWCAYCATTRLRYPIQAHTSYYEVAKLYIKGEGKQWNIAKQVEWPH